VKVQHRANKLNEEKLKQFNEKADNLEMDNYVMKESINELLKLNGEQKGIVTDLLRSLDKEPNTSKSFNEMRKHLVTLASKLSATRRKTMEDFMKGDPIMNEKENAEDANEEVLDEYANDMGGSNMKLNLLMNNMDLLKKDDDKQENDNEEPGDITQELQKITSD
jgi:hypothetical protein